MMFRALANSMITDRNEDFPDGVLFFVVGGEMMDKVEQRKWFVNNFSPHKCPRCEKPTITKGQYCSAECGVEAAKADAQNKK